MAARLEVHWQTDLREFVNGFHLEMESTYSSMSIIFPIIWGLAKEDKALFTEWCSFVHSSV